MRPITSPVGHGRLSTAAFKIHKFVLIVTDGMWSDDEKADSIKLVLLIVSTSQCFPVSGFVKKS